MYKIQLTFLAMIRVPAAVVVVVIEHGLSAQRIVLNDAWTNITALFGLLVPGDVIVELCVHDKGPIYGVQVAEFWILLNADGTTGDVPQVVKTNVLQTGHFKNYKSVVIKEVSSTDDRKVGKECTQTVQARNPEQQQVVSNHGQLGKAEGVEDFLVGVIVFIIDEQYLQVALHHSAVLKLLEITDVIANVDAETTNCKKGENKTDGELSFSYINLSTCKRYFLSQVQVLSTMQSSTPDILNPWATTHNWAMIVTLRKKKSVFQLGALRATVWPFPNQ